MKKEDVFSFMECETPAGEKLFFRIDRIDALETTNAGTRVLMSSGHNFFVTGHPDELMGKLEKAFVALRKAIGLFLLAFLLPGCQSWFVGAGLNHGEYLEVEDDVEDALSLFFVDVDADPIQAFHVRAGGFVHENLALELMYEKGETELEFTFGIVDADVDQHVFTGNLRVHPYRGVIDPWFLAGIGVQALEIDDQFDDDDDTVGVLRLGVGAAVDTSTPVRPYLEAGIVLPMSDADLFEIDVDSSYWVIGIGIAVEFGGGADE